MCLVLPNSNEVSFKEGQARILDSHAMSSGEQFTTFRNIVNLCLEYEGERTTTFRNVGNSSPDKASRPQMMCIINLLAPELFFLILAHPVYKMSIIQETNTLEL
jgi:hypothetical protein